MDYKEEIGRNMKETRKKTKTKIISYVTLL